VRILIVTGGTGSIALQAGFYNGIEKRFDGVETKILVNAYDNGLSTGEVRRVMDGRILGPSDIRKNHSTRLQLYDAESPWISFLETRFTVEATEARALCEQMVRELIEKLSKETPPATGLPRTLSSAIEAFFSQSKSTSISYRDFSLANIIYAGLARINGYSLRAAATLMAEAIGIPDSVIINDDESLFLGAITRCGRRIADEGEIVSWGNGADPFIDIFFSDPDGRLRTPQLCLEAWISIVEADLILLSCGTQWSSLIPTYASDGFKSAIGVSKATVLLIMNRVPDKDSPSQTASDIVKVLIPRYIEPGRVHVIADTNADLRMRGLDDTARGLVISYNESRLSMGGDESSKYDPSLLFSAVSTVFFRDYLNADYYMFDYDDTLVGRNGTYLKSSRFNIEALSRLNSLTNVAICTGNAANAIELGAIYSEKNATKTNSKPLPIFADGGVNMYVYEERVAAQEGFGISRFVECVEPDSLLPKAGQHSASTLLDTLRKARIQASTIQNRGNALIAIKPVRSESRRALFYMVSHLIQGSGLTVRASGTTTVEICLPSLSKVHAINHVLGTSTDARRLVYVGDECRGGNDSEVFSLSLNSSEVRCLGVNNPAMTAFFLLTLVQFLSENVEH